MADTIITSTTENPRKWVPKIWDPTSVFANFNPGVESVFFEEWLNASALTAPNIIGNNLWEYVVSGGGVSAVNVDATSPGVVQLQASTGRAVIWQNNNCMVLGGNSHDIRTRVRVTNTATSGEAYTAQVGLADTTGTGAQVDGVYFQHDQTTGVWTTKTRSNSIETSTSTAVTVNANTWYSLRILINTAASSVQFYIGTSSANLALVATHTTNIPTGTSRSCGPMLKMLKTNGSSARNLQNDYFWMHSLMGSVR
jgi:hypothetical protein